MNIEEIYSLFVQHPVVCTDTRKIELNSIFFALKGPNFNANNFAEEALNKGAAYVVIDEEQYKINDILYLIQFLY